MLLSILQAGLLVGLGISFFTACYRLVATKDSSGVGPGPRGKEKEHAEE